MLFKNRLDATKQLISLLNKFHQEKNLVVYALPRGGVVLGVIIAKALKANFDLIIPRKIGHPAMTEYAICALTEGGSLICNEEERTQIDERWLQEEVAKEKKEAKRRAQKYLKNRPRITATGKTAIIIDDGIATGLTMKAAILDIQKQHPSKIIIAVPVVPKETYDELASMVDEVITLNKDELFRGAIGAYYQEFEQVTDEAVIELLKTIDQSQ